MNHVAAQKKKKKMMSSSSSSSFGEGRPKDAKDAKRITLPMVVILTYVILAFVPRLALYGFIFVVGQMCRAVAKLVCHSVGAPHAANKRVLIITDYMPPQVHGIALRVSQYTKYLRAAGHEVHVYTCCVESRACTSFDHPTLPFVSNPFNLGNQISYSVGVKLAWALGAESWDVVHVFYPSMLGLFVLPACRWRGIASYCSHHVDIDHYARKYIQIDDWPVLQVVARAVVGALYDICYRLPATFWGDVNASMTRVFVEQHLPLAAKHSHVATIGSGVDADRFNRGRPNTTITNGGGGGGGGGGGDSRRRLRHQSTADDPDDDDKNESAKNHASNLLWLWVDKDCHDEREALCRRIGAPNTAQVWLMVQRLAPEKDTHVALEALALMSRRARAGADVPYLVIAGDGPAREGLEQRAEELFPSKDRAPRIHFLGSVNNARLPTLYRACDVFVTCSRSETFGLTVTEALACGATVALPMCPVFDELYGDVLPPAWRYDADDPRGAEAALVDAVEIAASRQAKEWLRKHPVEVSWEAAAKDLDEQYTDAITRSHTKYSTTRQFIQKRLIHLCRASILAVSFYFILSFYYRKMFCTDDVLYFCHSVVFPTVPRRIRIVALFTSIIALEWAHC
ncbi:hypothetical protein CTAYLR_001310 [Chrysophaeum taylorii]|uniref:Uncharacterized protein n=1 Tax=Chrysophaeum taylorii TaxID=2483200 RepID=A0AAD7UDE6_9STRA|nr:hypothetical protein CTAYLR_001310 [Chrysophaeum taylorii]